MGRWDAPWEAWRGLAASHQLLEEWGSQPADGMGASRKRALEGYARRAACRGIAMSCHDSTLPKTAEFTRGGGEGWDHGEVCGVVEALRTVGRKVECAEWVCG